MEIWKPFAPTFLKIPTRQHRCNKVGHGIGQEASAAVARGANVSRNSQMTRRLICDEGWQWV
jgi:hypothetical protein